MPGVKASSDDVPIYIWMTNKKCMGIEEATCPKIITVQVGEGDNSTKIRLTPDGVTVNEIPVSYPYNLHGVFIRSISSMQLRFSHEAGFNILWDGNLRTEIQISSKYAKKVSYTLFTYIRCSWSILIFTTIPHSEYI